MIRDLLKRSAFVRSVFAFNQEARDLWVQEQAAQLQLGSRILDVGAGSCPYRSLFAHCDYRTQDIARLMPGQLRHGAYGEIDYLGDAANIPAPTASFDAILCTEVLEHHPEPISVVRELGRLLRPGGVLLLTAPLGSGIHQEPYHFYGGYTPYWYQRFLAEAGFENIEIEANAGFFRFFGQESIRFMGLAAPWHLRTPVWVRVLWTPGWILLLPLLGVLMPLLGVAIDSWDRERRFTVGYHVKARRAALKS